MQITERVVGQAVILSLNGRFVFDVRKSFQQAIQKAHEKSPRKIVLNMEGVTYLDSAGLGLIALASEQAKIQHIVFCLVNPVGAVRRLLDLAQLPKILPVHETEEQALRPGPAALASAT